MMDNKLADVTSPIGSEVAGRGLTEKRRRVLALFTSAARPLSAYELTDAYNQQYTPPIKAMSVYRILRFLEAQHWVHRLHSANKYLACSRQHACDSHPLVLFLLCRDCGRVEETPVAEHLQCLLASHTAQNGFSVQESQLEISGLCAACQTKRKHHENVFV